MINGVTFWVLAAAVAVVTLWMIKEDEWAAALRQRHERKALDAARRQEEKKGSAR